MSGAERSSLLPNSFATPNVYADRLMFLLSGSEWKVLTYMSRRIFGFQKRSDRISTRQIVDGLEIDGRQVEFGTGLSLDAASKALQALRKYRVIVLVAENDKHKNEGTEYGLQTDGLAIDWEGLVARQDENAAKSQKQTAGARRKLVLKLAAETPANGTPSVQQNGCPENGVVGASTPSVEQNGSDPLCSTEQPPLLDRTATPSVEQNAPPLLNRTSPVLFNRDTKAREESQGKARSTHSASAAAPGALVESEIDSATDPYLPPDLTRQTGEVIPQTKLGVNGALRRYYGSLISKSDDVSRVISLVEQHAAEGRTVTETELLQAADTARAWWLEHRDGNPRSVNPYLVALNDLLNPVPRRQSADRTPPTGTPGDRNGYADRTDPRNGAHRGPRANRPTGRDTARSAPSEQALERERRAREHEAAAREQLARESRG